MKAPWQPLQDPALRLVARVSEVLNNRTPREKVLALVFAAAIVLALDFWIWANPVLQSLAVSVPRNHELRNKVDELRQLERSKETTQKRYESLKSKLEQRQAALVDSAQVSSLLESLSKTAGASGVKITSVHPADRPASDKGKNFKPVPIQISAVAGTHEIGRFLERLETGEILIKVTNLSVSAEAGLEIQHKVEMSVEAYRNASAGAPGRA